VLSEEKLGQEQKNPSQETDKTISWTINIDQTPHDLQLYSVGQEHPKNGK
jgi:hypothetical protein